MKKIYEIEIVQYEVNYLSRGRTKVKYDCIYFGNTAEYCETLEEAEERLKFNYKYSGEKNGVIIYEITSIKDYNTMEEFIEEFEEVGNDEENFFMEHIKEINREIEEEEYLEYVKSEDFKKEIEEEIIRKIPKGKYGLECELCDIFQYTEVEVETDYEEEQVFLYAREKTLGLKERCEYYLGEVIYEYLEDEKCYLVKEIEWSK